MPPAKRIIRSGQTFNSVADFVTTTEHKNVYKPYNVLSMPSKQMPLEKSNCKISTSSERFNAPSSKYMDLNEFYQNVEENDVDLQTEADPDYPKPTVDLLASLLTLGKMIQNQKQFIQNQSKHDKNPTSTSSSLYSSPMSRLSDYSENNNSRPVVQQGQTHLESIDMDFGDQEDNFHYSQKKTSSTSSSHMSKRRVIPDDIKDIDYWDRRKRNNLAAKKSREERRKKELEVVETTKQLEDENSQLTIMLKRLTSRNEWLESRLQDIRCRHTTDGSSSLSSEDS